MENIHKLNLRPFLTSQYYMHELYGLSIDDTDFIERAMIAYKEIGNYNRNTNVMEVEVDEDMFVEIPEIDPDTGVKNPIPYRVLAITRQVTNDDLFLDPLSYYEINYGESTYSYETPQNMRDSNRRPVGDYLNYTPINDYKFKINSHVAIGSTVRIIFSALITDEEGLPAINEKQAKAIAARVAWMETTKKAYMGDQSAINMLQFITQESERLTGAARIPEILTDNEHDKILDVQLSHNRKRYNRSYKMVK